MTPSATNASLRWLAVVAGTVWVALTGSLDYWTGYEVRLFPLYFLPVAFVGWHVSRNAAVAISILSAIGWALSNALAGRIYASPYTWPINCASQLVAFSTVGILVAELRHRLLVERDLSRRDTLTSLPNSRGFYERGEWLLSVARRSHRPLTIAYLDLDNFKQVNDERGHQEGDRALAATGAMMMRHVRASDLVARLGGDEFAMLLLDAGPEGAASSLERLRDMVASAMHENRWPVTVSIGAVCYRRAPATLDDAVREADAVMYRAKGAGKDRVHIEVIDAEPELVADAPSS